MGTSAGALQSPMLKTSGMQRGQHPFPQPCHNPCQTGKITSPASPGFLQSLQTLSGGMPHLLLGYWGSRTIRASGCTHTMHVLPRTSHFAMPGWSICQALPSLDSTSPFPKPPPLQTPTFPCHCAWRCPKYQNHGSPPQGHHFGEVLRTETCQGKPCARSWPNTQQGRAAQGS